MRSFLLATLVFLGSPASAQVFLGASRLVPPDNDPDGKADSLSTRVGTSRTEVRFVLDGSLLNAPSGAASFRAIEDSTGTTTPATGRAGIQLLVPDAELALSAQVGIASTETTLEDGAAAAILTPGTGGGIFESGLLYAVHRVGSHKTKEFVSNVYGYVSGSNATWSVRARLTDEAEGLGVPLDSLQQTRGIASLEERVAVLGVGGGYRFDLLPGGDTRGDFGVTATLGFALRHLGGDLGAARLTAFRDVMIQTEQRTFVGVELGVQVRVKDVVAGIQAYRLSADREVPGLGGIRLVAGIGAAIDLPGGTPSSASPSTP